MKEIKDRPFFKPLSVDGPYRYNPSRAVPPKVLVGPFMHAMLFGTMLIPHELKKGFRECFDVLSQLYPVVSTGYMEAGHFIDGGFSIRTIWANNPFLADIIFVQSPDDMKDLDLFIEYERTQEEALLSHLIQIDLPYIV